MVVLLKLADREAEAPYIQHKLKRLWMLKWSFPVFLNHDSKIVKHHKSHTFTFKRKAYQHLLYRKWKRFKASYTYMFHLSLFALTVIYTLCLSVRYPAGGLWERKYSNRWRERLLGWCQQCQGQQGKERSSLWKNVSSHSDNKDCNCGCWWEMAVETKGTHQQRHQLKFSKHEQYNNITLRMRLCFIH